MYPALIESTENHSKIMSLSTFLQSGTPLKIVANLAAQKQPSKWGKSSSVSKKNFFLRSA
jgi:hypothetical protein